jgi:hypothetical protein
MSNSNAPGELAIPTGAADLYVSVSLRVSSQTGVFGIRYPLPGESFFLQDQVLATTPGVTTSNNLNY